MAIFLTMFLFTTNARVSTWNTVKDGMGIPYNGGDNYDDGHLHAGIVFHHLLHDSSPRECIFTIHSFGNSTGLRDESRSLSLTMKEILVSNLLSVEAPKSLLRFAKHWCFSISCASYKVEPKMRCVKHWHPKQLLVLSFSHYPQRRSTYFSLTKANQSRGLLPALERSFYRALLCSALLLAISRIKAGNRRFQGSKATCSRCVKWIVSKWNRFRYPQIHAVVETEIFNALPDLKKTNDLAEKLNVDSKEAWDRIFEQIYLSEDD